MKTGKEGLPPSKPPPILFLIGPEKWFKEQAVRRLKAEWIAPGFEEMDLETFSELPEDPQRIVQAVSSIPFGSPLRLVVVGGLADAGEKALPWLAPILAHPPGKGCLILCADRLEKEAAVSSWQRSGVAQILWCRPLQGKELEDWVAEQARKAGTGIEPAAARLLIRRLGSRLSSLANALEGLALLAGLSSRITAAHVEALIAPSVRETAFDLLDGVAAGRLEEGLAGFKAAVQQGAMTVEQLMGALGWYYRFVWKSRQGAGGASWISPGRQAALRRLAGWPLPKLEEAMADLLEAEVDLKLGHPAPELLADRLLLKLGS